MQTQTKERPKSAPVPSQSIADKANVRAFVILKGERVVAQIHIKFPADGAGRMTGEVWSNSEKDARFQKASAGGYGYDKQTALLSGLTIDGHKLTNHCGGDKKAPASGVWPKGSEAPKGWYFINWKEIKNAAGEVVASGYSSCYRRPGLEYLQAIGYNVVQVF